MSENKSETKFCPHDNSILNPVVLSPDDETNDEKTITKKGLYMRCGSCGYTIEKATFSTIHFTKKVQRHSLNMDPVRIPDLIYDKTYMRTTSISCVNKDCASRKQGKNPEIVLITSNKHPELGYLCTICKSIWGKY